MHSGPSKICKDRPRRVSRHLMLKSRADSLFGLYYELGAERSLAKLRSRLRDLGIKIAASTLNRYSSRFGWQARVLEMDAKLQERRENTRIEAVLAMNRRQAQLGKGMQTVAAGGLRRLVDMELDAHAVSALARDGVKIERLALGEATSRAELAVQVVNAVVVGIVELFREVNALPDPKERIRRFAEGADQIIDAKLAETAIQYPLKREGGGGD